MLHRSPICSETVVPNDCEQHRLPNHKSSNPDNHIWDDQRQVTYVPDTLCRHFTHCCNMWRCGPTTSTNHVQPTTGTEYFVVLRHVRLCTSHLVTQHWSVRAGNIRHMTPSVPHTLSYVARRAHNLSRHTLVWNDGSRRMYAYELNYISARLAREV
jgi:hypothetical protein